MPKRPSRPPAALPGRRAVPPSGSRVPPPPPNSSSPWTPPPPASREAPGSGPTAIVIGPIARWLPRAYSRF